MCTGGICNLNETATSATPISTRKASDSILVVGCSATNFATGPDDTYMITQAITTAATMISRSCAIPIAVMMESSENTMSMITIWTITQKKALGLGAA